VWIRLTLWEFRIDHDPMESIYLLFISFVSWRDSNWRRSLVLFTLSEMWYLIFDLV
jgi:hypothetical protein